MDLQTENAKLTQENANLKEENANLRQNGGPEAEMRAPATGTGGTQEPSEPIVGPHTGI